MEKFKAVIYSVLLSVFNKLIEIGVGSLGGVASAIRPLG